MSILISFSSRILALRLNTNCASFPRLKQDYEREFSSLLYGVRVRPISGSHRNYFQLSLFSVRASKGIATALIDSKTSQL